MHFSSFCSQAANAADAADATDAVSANDNFVQALKRDSDLVGIIKKLLSCQMLESAESCKINAATFGAKSFTKGVFFSVAVIIDL